MVDKLWLDDIGKGRDRQIFVAILPVNSVFVWLDAAALWKRVVFNGRKMAEECSYVVLWIALVWG